jgi:hypothetical protein
VGYQAGASLIKNFSHLASSRDRTSCPCVHQCGILIMGQTTNREERLLLGVPLLEVFYMSITCSLLGLLLCNETILLGDNCTQIECSTHLTTSTQQTLQLCKLLSIQQQTTTTSFTLTPSFNLSSRLCEDSRQGSCLSREDILP